jgi:hypothetical protein
MGFVNDLKSLILQLGCVSGALSSDNYAAKDSGEKSVVPVTFGVHVSMDPSGNYRGTNSSPLMADTRNHQSNFSQASRLVGQPSHSLVKEIQNNLWTASTYQTPNQTHTLPKTHGGLCQQKAIPMMKPNFSFNGRIENGAVGAEVIPPNPDAWLSQQTSSYASRTGFNCEPGFGQLVGSHSGQNLMDQHILLSAGVHDHVNKNLSASSSFKMSQMRTNGGLILDPHIDSSEGSKLHGGINSHLRPNPVPYSLRNSQRAAEINLSGTHLTGIELQYTDSSKVKGDPFHSLAEQLTTGDMLLGEVDQRRSSSVAKHNQIELAPRAQRMDTDLFQALEISYTQPDKPISSSEHIPGFVTDCQSGGGGNQTLLTNAKHEGACASPPSGDDLFDILGVDFKNKLFNDTWNNLLDNGSDANRQKNLGENSLALMSTQDLGSDFYSVSEGISESGILSGMNADHLLDAVVSRAHSASNQRSDDDVSCRTTLTKISSSSVPSSSPTYGRVSMSDHMQGEFFGHPKPLGKVGTVESSSLRSGCSKDDAGNCSQSTSICGSHISSWVEQGNNVKRDSSLSTAYSKRPDEINKSNRKRLKPGENPRPRPKDRQMIQDRVKELREIVPNGGKVMLFFFASITLFLSLSLKFHFFLSNTDVILYSFNAIYSVA